jgi:hypothetical protein
MKFMMVFEKFSLSHNKTASWNVSTNSWNFLFLKLQFWRVPSILVFKAGESGGTFFYARSKTGVLTLL